MKIGDLIYYRVIPKEWGILLKEHRGQYLVHWYDGDTSWINMVNVAKLEVQ